MPAPWKDRPLARQLAAAIVAGSLAACANGSTATEPEEGDTGVQSVMLLVGLGSSIVTIDKSTGTPSGQLVVPAGGANITAVWRKADGFNDPRVTATEFEFRLVPTNSTNLSWRSSGGFGGTLTTIGLTSAQATTAQVSLFHTDKQHVDFGPYTITIRIQ